MAMKWRETLRSNVKAARRRGRIWVRIFDTVKLLPSAQGRARLWTMAVHGKRVHQTTPDTAEDRYPTLFNMAATLLPDAKRIMSFGCSTGAELVAIRKRFPNAEIVGVEINPRSRRMAARRVSADALTVVLSSGRVDGAFDLIFALAVLQREPQMVTEVGMLDLGRHYPFEKFDAAVSGLAGRLRPGGLLCVANAHYPVELSTAAGELEAIPDSPEMMQPLFGRDSRILGRWVARTIFRKHAKYPDG